VLIGCHETAALPTQATSSALFILPHAAFPLAARLLQVHHPNASYEFPGITE
jgi:hypothetical protein